METLALRPYLLKIIKEECRYLIPFLREAKMMRPDDDGNMYKLVEKCEKGFIVLSFSFFLYPGCKTIFTFQTRYYVKETV
jgi:hypothetical protein